MLLRSCITVFTAVTLVASTLLVYPNCVAAQQPSVGTTSLPTDELPSSVHQLPANLIGLEKTPERIDKELKLEQEGEAFLAQHNLDKSLGKWQEAYGLSIEMGYPEGQGRCLTGMSQLYLERQQYAKAKELGENAIELLANSDSNSLVKARIALAQAYYALDNKTFAAQQLQLALGSFSDIANTNAKEAAKLAQLAGAMLFKDNKIKEAIQFYEQAATLYMQAGNYIACINLRNMLVGIFQELGLYTAANEEALKCLNESKQSQDKDLVASALVSLATSQYNLCEFAAACTSYEEALQTISSKWTDVSKGNFYAGYGTVLFATGNADLARDYLLKALPLLRQNAPAFSQSQTLNTLANIETTQKHYLKAINLFNQALDLASVITPRQDKLTVSILQNLAACEYRGNMQYEARAHLESALADFKKFNSPLLQGRTLSSLAEVLIALKDYPKAESIVQEAIGASEKINDDASLWRDYTLLAELQLAASNTAGAKESLTSALSYFRSPQAGVFPSPDRLGFASTREDFGHKLISLLVSQEMVEPALIVAEQMKEESFINEWVRHGGQVKLQDHDLYQDLVYQRAHLHATESIANPSTAIANWKNWLSRFKILTQENPSLARLIAPIPLTYAQIVQSISNSKATIIDYAVGPTSIIAFVINPNGKLAAIKSNSGLAQLQNQLSLLFSSNQTDSDTKHLLSTLYTELIPASLTTFLPHDPNQLLVFIPDGPLYNLPFCALLNTNNKYLIEEHTITTVPSIATLLNVPPRSGEGLSVAITPSSADNSTEVSAISQTLTPSAVTRLPSNVLDLETFAEQSRGKTILHIPTNVTIKESNPLDTPFLISDPSHRFTVGQLFSTNLANDLAILSDTTFSTKNTISIQLLSRGFNYAGVRNVLLSLWQEPTNNRTSELTDFYKAERDGLSQAQSLRKAEIAAISKEPLVRSWAAFQLVGPGY